MATATFSIRMDNVLKKDFADICKSFGMNVSTAINVFAKTVVNQKKIPFEIISPYSEDFMSSINTLRSEAKKNKKSGMSLDEINKIIKTTRREKKCRAQKDAWVNWEIDKKCWQLPRVFSYYIVANVSKNLTISNNLKYLIDILNGYIFFWNMV